MLAAGFQTISNLTIMPNSSDVVRRNTLYIVYQETFVYLHKSTDIAFLATLL